MRNKIFTIIIFSVFYFSKECFSKGCHIIYYLNNVSVDPHSSLFSIDTLFNEGGSINMQFAFVTSGDCQKSGSCYMTDVWWTKNGMQDSVPNFYYLISDTGLYVGTAMGISCSASFDFILTIHVHYRPTSVYEISNANTFCIYPSLSNGIFKIKSTDKNLKQLYITDNAGQIVLSSTNNFSEINLTNFSPGIYFYAITDEKENEWRGKIIKQ